MIIIAVVHYYTYTHMSSVFPNRLSSTYVSQKHCLVGTSRYQATIVMGTTQQGNIPHIDPIWLAITQLVSMQNSYNNIM